MKKGKLIGILSVVLVVIIGVFAVVLITQKIETEKGKKEIEVTVVYKDKTEKDFEIKTEAEFLGDALYNEGLVTEEEYKSGFYTVIDGVKADFSVDKSWWCVLSEGEMLQVGMNDQPIKDGDSFEIEYTID